MTYRSALLRLALLQGLYFCAVLFGGQVFSPHNNSAFVGGPQRSDGRLSTQWLSDHHYFYIPAINCTLNGRSRGWIPTWNPHVELGRPPFHLAGFSKAYLLTHVLSLLTNDPFRLYTFLTVSTVLLMGWFFFAFLKTIGLGPCACLCSSAGLSLGVYSSHWLTFLQYVSTLCWSAGLLWLIAVFVRRRSLPVVLGISFFVYSLLMTGAVRYNVAQAYVITAFTLIELYHASGKRTTRLATAGMLLAAAAGGAIMALPVYLDLVLSAGRSVRLQVTDDQFLLTLFPKIRGLGDLVSYLHGLWDSFWHGNPMVRAEGDTSYMFWGLSLTPFHGCLALLSLLLIRQRSVWLWLTFCLLGLVGSIWPPAYLFAVHHLGFHFSRCQLLVGALIPASLLGGYVVDYLLRAGVKRRVAVSILLLMPLLLAGLASSRKGAPALHLGYVSLAGALVIGTIALVWTRNVWLLQGLLLVSVFAYGHRLMLCRPKSEICLSSALIEAVKAETQDGSRMAKCGHEIWSVVPPNQEALFGIRSIHTYNSLSPRSYNRLTSRISQGGSQHLGRAFRFLHSESGISDPAFSYCGVGVIVSKRSLERNGLQRVTTVGDLNLYKPATPPILHAQLRDYTYGPDGNVVVEGPLSAHSLGKIRVVESFDDWRRYRVRPSATTTLLFLSQQYHPQWRAASRSGPLRTVVINDFFQGVLLPAGVEEVTLQFRPHVRLSWLPQLLFLLAAAGCSVRWFRRRKPPESCTG